jgi:hydroxymethylbilane synthase
LWQANHVAARLRSAVPGISVDLQPIKTTGDKILDVPLAQVGGKALFVKEIEEALLEGRVDLAVHSMKDVPTDLPLGLAIAAITEREDPLDVLISRAGKGLKDLPRGARVGTSSLRRQAQLLHHRTDLAITGLRGNLDTRIRKLESEGLDAIVVAAAAMKRLGWTDRITEFLSPEVCLPAIGQGALGVEGRQGDATGTAAAAAVDHRETHVAVVAERAFLRRLTGGCQVPFAAYAEVKGDCILLRGLVASPDGTQVLRGERSGICQEGEVLGVALAEDLLDRGAGEIIDTVLRRS